MGEDGEACVTEAGAGSGRLLVFKDSAAARFAVAAVCSALLVLVALVSSSTPAGQQAAHEPQGFLGAPQDAADRAQRRRLQGLDRPRAAVVLFGIHYNANTVHKDYQGTFHLRIDYRWSLANYRSHIYEYLDREGFAVDTFFCTYSSAIEQELLKDFRPVKHELVMKSADTSGYMARWMGRNSEVACSMKLAKEYSSQNNFQYARVMVTRFDLIFREEFIRSNFDWRCFNVVSPLEKDMYIDDNFYAFPGAFLDPFVKVVERTLTRTSHELEPDLKQFSKVNYIWENRGKFVAEQHWYYIVRNRSDGTGCIVCK